MMMMMMMMMMKEPPLTFNAYCRQYCVLSVQYCQQPQHTVSEVWLCKTFLIHWSRNLGAEMYRTGAD